MNLYRIGVVATGLMGLWLMVEIAMHSLSLIGLFLMNPTPLSAGGGSGEWLRPWALTALIGATFVLAVLMIAYRRQITRAWLLADTDMETTEVSESLIAKLAFALFGLSLVIRGLYLLIHGVGRVVSRPNLVGELMPGILLPLIFVGLGFFVFHYAPRLAVRLGGEKDESGG